MHGREAVALQQLGASVVDLDTREVRGAEILVGGEARPVGVGEEGDTALPGDPARCLGDRRELLARLGELVDPVRQDVGLEAAVEPRGQLARGDQEDVARPVRRGLVQRDQPVVRDREHVVARSRVVLHQPGGGRLTVGVVGVGVQLAAEPRAGMVEGRWHAGHGI